MPALPKKVELITQNLFIDKKTDFYTLVTVFKHKLNFGNHCRLYSSIQFYNENSSQRFSSISTEVIISFSQEKEANIKVKDYLKKSPFNSYTEVPLTQWRALLPFASTTESKTAQKIADYPKGSYPENMNELLEIVFSDPTLIRRKRALIRVFKTSHFDFLAFNDYILAHGSNELIAGVLKEGSLQKTVELERFATSILKMAVSSVIWTPFIAGAKFHAWIYLYCWNKENPLLQTDIHEIRSFIKDYNTNPSKKESVAQVFMQNLLKPSTYSIFKKYPLDESYKLIIHFLDELDQVGRLEFLSCWITSDFSVIPLRVAYKRVLRFFKQFNKPEMIPLGLHWHAILTSSRRSSKFYNDEENDEENDDNSTTFFDWNSTRALQSSKSYWSHKITNMITRLNVKENTKFLEVTHYIAVLTCKNELSSRFAQVTLIKLLFREIAVHFRDDDSTGLISALAEFFSENNAESLLSYYNEDNVPRHHYRYHYYRTNEERELAIKKITDSIALQFKTLIVSRWNEHRKLLKETIIYLLNNDNESVLEALKVLEVHFFMRIIEEWHELEQFIKELDLNELVSLSKYTKYTEMVNNKLIEAIVANTLPLDQMISLLVKTDVNSNVKTLISSTINARIASKALNIYNVLMAILELSLTNQAQITNLLSLWQQQTTKYPLEEHLSSEEYKLLLLKVLRKSIDNSYLCPLMDSLFAKTDITFWLKCQTDEILPLINHSNESIRLYMSLVYSALKNELPWHKTLVETCNSDNVRVRSLTIQLVDTMFDKLSKRPTLMVVLLESPFPDLKAFSRSVISSSRMSLESKVAVLKEAIISPINEVAAFSVAELKNVFANDLPLPLLIDLIEHPANEVQSKVIQLFFERLEVLANNQLDQVLHYCRIIAYAPNRLALAKDRAYNLLSKIGKQNKDIRQKIVPFFVEMAHSTILKDKERALVALALMED